MIRDPELRAECPACGWTNDGALRALIAYDTGYVMRERAWRLFADGTYSADVDDYGNAHLEDVRECPSCEFDADNVAEWVGIVLLRSGPTLADVVAESESEGLDAIAREEADTLPRARSTDPQTSHDAARSVRALTEKQQAVLQMFLVHQVSGLTDEELVDRYVGPAQSASGLRTRRSELVRRGDLMDTGERRQMITGRMATVWGLPS